MGLYGVVFFCFKSGCRRGPRAKLLDNPLVVNPPQSNHMHSLPPSMLRWVYKHLLLLGVRPVPVRQSCPAASQLLSLHRFLQTVIKPASQPAALPQTSPVHCADIFHSRACFPNVLSILLARLETLSSFWCSPWRVQRCSPGLKTEVMKASRTHRLALFKCPWVSCGHKKLPEEIRSGNLS